MIEQSGQTGLVSFISKLIFVRFYILLPELRANIEQQQMCPCSAGGAVFAPLDI